MSWTDKNEQVQTPSWSNRRTSSKQPTAAVCEEPNCDGASIISNECIKEQLWIWVEIQNPMIGMKSRSIPTLCFPFWIIKTIIISDRLHVYEISIDL